MIMIISDWVYVEVMYKSVGCAAAERGEVTGY